MPQEKNSKTIKFLCYSDIHHHEYTNGLTGDDVVNVEKQFCHLVETLKPDFWCFLGDRFVSRNPLDISKFKSDTAIKALNDLNIPGIIVPGNHDQYYKSGSRGNSYQHMKTLYKESLQNIKILDQKQTYQIRLNDRRLVSVHATPAGYENDPTRFNLSLDEVNILLYHGMVKDSRYVNGMAAEDGTEPKTLDLPVDVVICGDNHKFQELPGFKNTLGWYVGAPMQHNWGDSDDVRGFLMVTIDADGTKVEHIPSKHPKFVKEEITAKTEEDLLKYCGSRVSAWVDNMVRLHVNCTIELLNAIDIPQIKDKMIQAGVRSLDIKPEIEKQTIITQSTNIVPDSTQWIDYINLHKDELKHIDIELLTKLGLRYINE